MSNLKLSGVKLPTIHKVDFDWELDNSVRYILESSLKSSKQAIVMTSRVSDMFDHTIRFLELNSVNFNANNANHRIDFDNGGWVMFMEVSGKIHTTYSDSPMLVLDEYA